MRQRIPLKSLRANDYPHVSQEFDANILRLVKKAFFFLKITAITLKN